MQRIFSILGWVGTAVVFGAVAIRFVRPEWDQYGTQAAWVGLVLVVLYTLGQWREILDYFRRRQARYGAVAAAGVLVALAIVVAVNYLASRQNKRWDLTANKQNSLSEQTVKVLQSLTAPVKFTVFDRSTDLERFRGRLTEYAYHSPQVSVEYIDPDARPVEAREFDIQAYGTVIIDYMGKRERVTSDAEQDLTNGLIKAMSTMERKVYFLQGHGEKEPNRTERDGYSAVSGSLRQDNYAVERLVLAQQKEVPDDATVLLIAGPTTDILDTEAEAIRRYLERAGKLMVMLDPMLGPQAAPMPNLESIVSEWGITIGNDVVVDLSGATNDPSIAVAATYPMHAITERFATLTIYPLARSIRPTEGGANGRTAQTIVETSRQSWAESDLASLSAESGVSMDEASGDTIGPIPLGVVVSAAAESPAADEDTPTTGEDTPAAGETLKPESRIVVLGDSDFPSNAYGGIPGNLNFFANAISWLAQQENLIAIRPTEAQDSRITMTPRQQTGVFWASIVVMPGLVFLAGIYTWWRRR
jgi:ABC-type uncharacterized transport system involved in gliding motility auxiliary subunit